MSDHSAYPGPDSDSVQFTMEMFPIKQNRGFDTKDREVQTSPIHAPWANDAVLQEVTTYNLWFWRGVDFGLYHLQFAFVLPGMALESNNGISSGGKGGMGQ